MAGKGWEGFPGLFALFDDGKPVSASLPLRDLESSLLRSRRDFLPGRAVCYIYSVTEAALPAGVALARVQPPVRSRTTSAGGISVAMVKAALAATERGTPAPAPASSTSSSSS